MAQDTERFAALLIPERYEGWRDCIEVKRGIALTAGYVRERLRILSDPGHEQARRFALTYGTDHLQRVVGWFGQAAAALGPADAAAPAGQPRGRP
jgi:hypothetical protein